MKTITPKEKQAWLISCINHTDYNDIDGEIDLNETSSNAEKLQYIADRLKSEAYYPFNIQRFHGNDQKIIADHLMGLPSWLHVPYINYDILQLLTSWGYDTSTSRKEDALLSRYWGSVAMLILIAFKAYKIKL